MSKIATSILSPTDLKDRRIRNRLAVAPMTRVTATEDGSATETMTRYYERFALGGFGLIITEGLYTDKTYSQGYLFQPGMSDEAQARSWQPVVRGIQGHGALAIAQIMHAGGISQGNRFRSDTVAPSAIQPKGRQLDFYYGKGSYELPRAMTEEEIADAVAAFGAAAGRAVGVSGFDGIEVHGANGYLLDQFLTRTTNARNDRYGGDTARRVAIIAEVVRAVRGRVGPGIPVGVRISQGKVNDFEHEWKDGKRDAEVTFGTLEDAGVDFIHVTEHKAWKPAFGDAGPTLTHLAKTHAPRAVIVANGNLQEPGRAEAALADGADIVAIGRAALANPDLPTRLAKGKALLAFDPSLLGPIADIKECELAL